MTYPLPIRPNGHGLRIRIRGTVRRTRSLRRFVLDIGNGFPPRTVRTRLRSPLIPDDGTDVEFTALLRFDSKGREYLLQNATYDGDTSYIEYERNR